eukprot:TRINITY_DN34836_c0_g1_i1.p1 TRINITY_DN34836_c0_g1~~TRINITY_DN34836_c0_g1_i1.p1  ORF type:complete len:1365 (+),score=345.52 TRINITY_DN34836_c0_g1_i1:125-4219(+)
MTTRRWLCVWSLAAAAICHADAAASSPDDDCPVYMEVNCLGWTVIWGSILVVAVLLLLDTVFVLVREQHLHRLQEKAGKRGLGKELVFHSPDDTPRHFMQFGMVQSKLGVSLRGAWALMFAIGYLYCIVGTWIAYAPQFGAPVRVVEAFGGWRGFAGAWCVVFTLAHVIWLLLILLWDPVRARFMYPVDDMSEATHVMIEECLIENTDADLVDPDEDQDIVSNAFLESTKKRLRGLRDRYKRAATRSIVKIRKEEDGTKQIEYTCVRYVLSEDDSTFHPVGIFDSSPVELCQVLARGGLTEEEAQVRMQKLGKNEIHVHVPGRMEAMVTEFSDFTYVVNSIGTWVYMIYSSWNIGLVWLFITLGSAITKALCIMLPNQRNIAELAQLHTECRVMRGGEWQLIDAADIVLGDIVCVDDDSAKLPCDGVVIEGSLVVNESMLTGEPMPIQKVPVENSANAAISKKNIAYAGTTCLQSTGPHDGKAVLIATAVGALTTRGQLVRMVLFPQEVRFKYNDQLPTIYMILGVYVMGCILLMMKYSDLGNWVVLYLMILCTVTMALSPMLPVSMVMGSSVTAGRLQREHEIQVLQPARIPIAGKISMMVFDKTGTITKDGMDFAAVVNVEGAKFGSSVHFHEDEAANRRCLKDEVNAEMQYALGCCHTVTQMTDGTFVGNAVEVSMVRMAGWTMEYTEDADGTHRNYLTSPWGDRLQVVKQLEFDHRRMTSGVVVKDLKTNLLHVYVKGSYERIQQISLPNSVPFDYDERTQTAAKEGYYTLGIATKRLPPGLTAQQLADMTRDSLEAQLRICGLLLFRNEMKWDSPQAIKALQKGHIDAVICTGDNALTGISIGRQCGIVTSQRVFLGEMKEGELVWTDPDANSQRIDIYKEAGSNLAVTQGAWRYLHTYQGELEGCWSRIKVFARMKPEDKINVVKYYQSRSMVTGMAGDGGNDCGGLRAAHAGLALSDAEASMVSPFASGRDGKSLMTVVDLIREGRACLATNLSTFMYFMVYGVSVTSVRVILTCFNSGNMGEWTWLIMDLFIGVVMVVGSCTQSKALPYLADYRPTATLLGPRTVSAILFPYLTMLMCWLLLAVMLWQEEWYVEKYDPIRDLHLLPQYWFLRGDNFDSAVAVFMLFSCLTTTAFINTYGGDFRQPVFKNKGVMVNYTVWIIILFVMVLSDPNKLNCIFRVNCDMAGSLDAVNIPVIAIFSVGGVGGCFLSSQNVAWQEQMLYYGYLGNSTENPFWLPDIDADPACRPWGSTAKPGFPSTITQSNAPNSTAGGVYPLDSPEISVNGCTGPSNCFSVDFKVKVALVMLAYIVCNHLFVKFFLQGPVASKIRARGRVFDSSSSEEETTEDSDSGLSQSE